MPVKLPENVLRQLIPAHVRWHAVHAGWKPVEGVKRPVIVLNHPTDDLTQIQIPTAGNDRQVAFLMAEAVETLARFENRSPEELLNELSLPPADMLRLHLDSAIAGSGSLPLDEGLNLFQGGRNLLLAAACSAHQPQAFFPRQSFTPAQEYLRNCRLGQTERGSYVVAIIAPVPLELAPTPSCEGQDDLFDAPYERRVTQILMLGLGLLRQGIDHGHPERIVNKSREGVSANLCDALAAMAPSDGQARLRISMDWSRSRSSVPACVPAQVVFAQSEFSVIRETGRLLREKAEPRRERLEGRVISLHAEPANLFDPLRGRVTIRALVADRSARVRFQLDEADYLRACEAHRNRRRIAVTGELHRGTQAKLFDLRQIQGFQILPEEPSSAV